LPRQSIEFFFKLWKFSAGKQNSMKVDLHAHSNESDGSLSPEELVDLAISQGISTLALCDHDTTAGLQRFMQYGSEKNLNTIPGIEISATWDKGGNCHILGLGVKADHAPLEGLLRQMRDDRQARNRLILEKLNKLGIKLQISDIHETARGQVLARPHIAEALVAKGVVGSIQDAFDRYLGKGGPAYVERFRLLPENAVRLLHEAGALVVLAHPSQLRLSHKDLEMFIQTLKPYGLAGLEVYTPYTTPETIKVFKAIAEKHKLLVTGGSDFHGKSKPDHKLGCHVNGNPIPVDCAEQVFARLYQPIAAGNSN
jgi:predicted metal-dependent phosphoesterase TrpH